MQKFQHHIWQIYHFFYFLEYLSKEKSQGEIRYRIYHQSFTDFLTKQKELDKNRKIFEEVVISINESEYRNSEISEILQG